MATSRTRKRPPLPARDLIPVRIEWNGPESTRVVLDEDGVSLRFASSGGLEEYDLDRLFAIVQRAKNANRAGSVNTPTPPSSIEVHAGFSRDTAKHVLAIAKRAVAEYYGDVVTVGAPF